ncbi:MAG: YraN family protein [Planctomycetota bacterium]|nr:MAG: YraN family protein [Planctomycetota bacterium]
MDLGRYGEDAALAAARARGARLLARNWRTRRGELDLVLDEGGVVVFVEVKARRGRSHGTGLQAVTPKKQRRLLRAAHAFLSATARCPDATPCRFDVAEVDGDGAVRWVEGAFTG